MTVSNLDRFRPKPTRDRIVYTVQEVADMLGLALGGTYTLIREGTIPALKMGGRWVVPKARFHKWIDGLDADDESEPIPPSDVPATVLRPRSGWRQWDTYGRRQQVLIVPAGVSPPAVSAPRPSRPGGRQTRSWPRSRRRSIGACTWLPTVAVSAWAIMRAGGWRPGTMSAPRQLAMPRSCETTFCRRGSRCHWRASITRRSKPG